MHDAIDAGERAVGDAGIADVADDELHALGQLGATPPCTCGSRLSSTTTSSPRSSESAHEVRADEPGSAGHERLHEYLILRR